MAPTAPGRCDSLADLDGCIQQALESWLPSGALSAPVLSIVGALTQHLIDQIQRQFAGSAIYIPKSHAYKRHARNLAILREFNGHNQADLARKYNLTVRGIYRILATERAKANPN